MKTDRQKEKENELVLYYLDLRKAVGIMGVLLPFVLIIGSFAFGYCKELQASISDYHNTNMRDVFVGVLCAISLFLFSYTGYNTRDKIMARLSGVLGFVVAIFHDDFDRTNSCTIIPPQDVPVWFPYVHFVAAGIFILTHAYLSICQFTKSNKPKGKEGKKKRQRNRIYRFCGYCIIACVVIIVTYVIIRKCVDGVEEVLKPFKLVLVFEIISLMAFGFSWAVKGEFILKDDEESLNEIAQAAN
jgi:hypothetical protein